MIGLLGSGIGWERIEGPLLGCVYTPLIASFLTPLFPLLHPPLTGAVGGRHRVRTRQDRVPHDPRRLRPQWRVVAVA